MDDKTSAVNLSVIKLTNDQVCDRETCPICGSKKITSEPSGCLCNRPGHSCWDHPICCDCGYTAGPGAGNSNGGIWVPFSQKPVDGFYEIKARGH